MKKIEIYAVLAKKQKTQYTAFSFLPSCADVRAKQAKPYLYGNFLVKGNFQGELSDNHVYFGFSFKNKSEGSIGFGTCCFTASEACGHSHCSGYPDISNFGEFVLAKQKNENNIRI